MSKWAIHLLPEAQSLKRSTLYSVNCSNIGRALAKLIT